MNDRKKNIKPDAPDAPFRSARRRPARKAGRKALRAVLAGILLTCLFRPAAETFCSFPAAFSHPDLCTQAAAAETDCVSPAAFPCLSLCTRTMAAEIGEDDTVEYGDEYDPGYEDDFDFEYEEPTEYIWPENGIVTRIPFPNLTFSDLWVNNDFADQQFFASATVPLLFFESYLDECKDLGFVLESSDSDFRDESFVSIQYTAYDPENNRLMLNYHGGPDAGNMDVMLQAPRTFGTLQWPDSGPALLLPLPPTTAGSIGGMPQMFLIVYLGNMSRDLYYDYVEECKAAGFTQNISETDTSFSATDQDGIQLSVSYEGAGTVAMQVLDPEQKWISRTQGVQQEDGDENAQTEDPAEGVPLPGGAEETDPAPPEEESGLPGSDTANESLDTANEANEANGSSESSGTYENNGSNGINDTNENNLIREPDETGAPNTGGSSSVTEIDQFLPGDAAGPENHIQTPSSAGPAALEAIDPGQDPVASADPADDPSADQDYSSPALPSLPAAVTAQADFRDAISRDTDSQDTNRQNPVTRKPETGVENAGSKKEAKALNKEESTEKLSGSATGPDRRAAWLIQPSAIRGSVLQDGQPESRGAFSSAGSAAVSEADAASSWPGSHSKRAVAVTGLLSFCIILAGAICKRKTFTRSLREEV